MEKRKTKPVSSINILAYIIIILSIFLIGREIYHYFTLPSTEDIPEIISLFKYKETAISQGFVWLLFSLFGIGLLFKNFLAWIIPQTFLLIGFVFFILFAFYEELSDISLVFIIIGLVYYAFCFVVFRYFIIGKPKVYFNIVKQRMPYYYVLAIFLTTSYWFIQFYI